MSLKYDYAPTRRPVNYVVRSINERPNQITNHLSILHAYKIHLRHN